MDLTRDLNMDTQKPYRIVVIPDDELRSGLLYEVLDDEQLAVIDRDALFSLMFSFVNDILSGNTDPDNVFDWFYYETSPVVEESEKITRSEKMIMLRALMREFVLIWINRLRNEGIIQNEYFAYDYAGLLRDGSFVFRRHQGLH